MDRYYYFGYHCCHQSLERRCVMDPFETTVRGLTSTANIRATITQIQNKIYTYGVCSDREWQFLQHHCDVGLIRQTEPE